MPRRYFVSLLTILFFVSSCAPNRSEINGLAYSDKSGSNKSCDSGYFADIVERNLDALNFATPKGNKEFALKEIGQELHDEVQNVTFPCHVKISAEYVIQGGVKIPSEYIAALTSSETCVTYREAFDDNVDQSVRDFFNRAQLPSLAEKAGKGNVFGPICIK